MAILGKMKNKIGILVGFIIINSIFMFIFTFEYSKYDINLMDETELTEKLVQLDGIGEAKASLIAQNRPYFSIEDIQAIQGIGKASMGQIHRHFAVRGWDMRTDVMLVIFVVSNVLNVLGCWLLTFLYSRKIDSLTINKYVKI